MTDPDRTRHVFVSYAAADGPASDEIVRAMREAGLRVFRDRDSLVPGQFWSERLEQALGDAQTVVVCLGPSGIGRWQKREIALAQERQVRDETFPVIPLLLPGADDIGLSFLRLYTWIDLREGADAPRALGTLFPCGAE